MVADDMGNKQVLEYVAKPDDRSSLWWWLLENHDSFLAAAGGRRILWKTVVKYFSDLGLTDRTGKPPSSECARLTWKRVRKEKARLVALSAKNAPRQAGVAQQPALGQAPAVVPGAGALVPRIDHSKARREGDAPVIPPGARRFNDKYWIDKQGFVVPTDNRAEACLVRQVQYKESGRDILTAITTLGPRTYFD
jgi:hypothetical protein